ncbi:hypothetical protein DOTSEDRAFT_49636 [Dothistroma septosporum NZE10]|uniref:tRNA-splicing endonuclease subunit Sen15 domain-containing protein n=1 Tax=Dothistroma septosporum (strain NZE10 / CBS 128990) TaxID=675120 RepID=N1Q0Z7_DOTSN|nr:hypothetical protein DOTSEDRAFT_49636 [Dothistroma septosporum NZE10]
MTVQEPPVASALQKLLHARPAPPDSAHSADLHHLALQIAHNLRYQHLWTDMRLHTHAMHTSDALPQPLLSGTPPRRIYVHPDEQIELLQSQKDHGKTGMPELAPQREWVLPSHLHEQWTLRRFGETFDAIGVEPEEGTGELLFPSPSESESESESREEQRGEKDSKWRRNLPKRLLLATLEDDSTVVYYIVHDGIVKPRQN